MKRVLTVDNILSQEIEVIEWEGEMYEAFGNPQAKGVWFIWATSGSGKSSFVMALCKALAKYYKVFYNPLEEGTNDLGFQERVKMYNMSEVKKNFHAQVYNLEELTEYLNVKRSPPKVVVIDSARYLFKSYSDYEALKESFPDIIFLITGHGKGQLPKTSMEEDIMFDAYQKIRVDAYAAQCKSRSIGPNGGRFIIWEKKYNELMGATHE